ncbi:aspartate/glutamate racemase family protein [Pseudoalteromonas sp. SSDWG2]|uniref:aspartate/glutamate racemase family protein n=1 Tax=Pseudoalteromonas sp. SSDWG2 TaxID=3139391 RepID=UPI003BAC014F
MKKIGIIGGMSWQSTQTYYKAINEGVNDHLGGLHSAELLMYSVDFAPIEQLQHNHQWPQLANKLSHAAQSLERAGADCIVIATNTMHKVADVMQENISIPIIHIADAVAVKLKQKGIDTVGLLGTAFTMEQDFYRQRLQDKHGIKVLIPDAPHRTCIHEVIYKELCHGHVYPDSHLAFMRIINELHFSGAQGIILGCTEIGLLVSQSDTDIALFDTTFIHAQAAVEFALS